MKIRIVILVIFVVISSCKDKIEKKSIANNDVSTAMIFSKSFNDSKKMKDLLDRVLKKGDTIAYNELQSIYFLSGHRLDFLYVSVAMSNRYKYNRAYYDTFTCLYRLNSSKDDTENWIFDKDTDVETVNYAIENLKKSSHLGYVEAKKIVELYKKQKRYVSE